MGIVRSRSLKQLNRTPKRCLVTPSKQQKEVAPKGEATKKVKENKKTKTTDMDTQEKIALAEQLLKNDVAPSVKRIKKDKGLLERVGTPSIILTEDNKELLND